MMGPKCPENPYVNHNRVIARYLNRAINFSMAEQKNRPLKELAAPLAHMDQVSFLKMLRFKLAAMNIYHHAAATKSSKYFWGAPRAIQRWQEQPVVESPDGHDEEDDEEDDGHSS